ncbi:hypothetical protein ACVIGB_001135 [Bradyrhizobium sp. USDA 4341]
MTNHPYDVEMEQSNFEDAVSAAIEKRIGSPVEIYESANLGVVAFARLTDYGGKLEWQELAAALARDTGVGVTCVANTDWTFDDRCDEAATFIAFDLPSVPENYRDHKYRNMIEAVDPFTAPSTQEFADAKRARSIVGDHLRELGSRYEMLIAARKNDRDVLNRIAEIETLKDLRAVDRAAVAAVLELDFDRALQAMTAEPEVAGLRP